MDFVKKTMCIPAMLLALLLWGCTQQLPPPTTLPTTPPTQATEATECAHWDPNEDGICNGCQSSVLVTFDIYAINDLHGKIADGDTHPGVDELSTYIKQARQTKDNVILLSTGDMWQGSSESNLTGGNLTTDWMNDLDFDAMVLGNHEFDWGEAPIQENADIAQFPFLAINIYDRATDRQVEYCQSSVVVDRDGIQIGIIGAMGDCYSSISAQQVQDVYFITGDALTDLVMAEAIRLRAEGVDFILYAIHDGYGESSSAQAKPVTGSKLRSYYDTALSAGYVDLVFEGHTHQRYLLRDEYGVYHLQNKGDNKGISHVTVSFNIANDKSYVEQAELLATGTYALMEDDPIVSQLLEKYADELAISSQILGYNSAQRERNELRQLVADLYYETGMAAWGDKYDIVLGGGFMSVRSPGNLPVGEVTYSMLQGLFPFDNQLTLCAVKGRELSSKFFYSSSDNYFLCYEDYGKSVRENIDPNATYYVIVDSYTAYYAPNKLTVVEEYDETVFARDLLAQYIRDGGFS